MSKRTALSSIFSALVGFVAAWLLFAQPTAAAPECPTPEMVSETVVYELPASEHMVIERSLSSSRPSEIGSSVVIEQGEEEIVEETVVEEEVAIEEEIVEESADEIKVHFNKGGGNGSEGGDPGNHPELGNDDENEDNFQAGKPAKKEKSKKK